MGKRHAGAKSDHFGTGHPTEGKGDSTEGEIRRPAGKERSKGCLFWAEALLPREPVAGTTGAEALDRALDGGR